MGNVAYILHQLHLLPCALAGAARQRTKAGFGGALCHRNPLYKNGAKFEIVILLTYVGRRSLMSVVISGNSRRGGIALFALADSVPG